MESLLQPRVLGKEEGCRAPLFENQQGRATTTTPAATNVYISDEDCLRTSWGCRDGGFLEHPGHGTPGHGARFLLRPTFRREKLALAPGAEVEGDAVRGPQAPRAARLDARGDGRTRRRRDGVAKECQARGGGA